MTDIELKLSQGLNRAIDKITPNNLDNILSISKKNTERVEHRRKPLYLKFGVGFVTLCIIVVAVSGLIIRQRNISSGDKTDGLVISGLTGYQSQIVLPNCSLYFNDGKASITAGAAVVSKTEPLYSEKDIIAQFGFDPLKNLRLPAGLKSTFCTPTDEKWYYDYAFYLRDNQLYWLTSTYMADPNNYYSKTIGIALSHNKPIISDIEPTGEMKISHIYSTKITITHQPKGNDPSFPNEMFSAKFTYKDIGYSIYTNNGVSQTEFINVLTSIIKS
jgi:hypothetical protein